MKTHIVQQTKHRYQKRSMDKESAGMGTLNDENKQQLDEKNNKN